MGKKAIRPEWAERLEHLRKELGWSQAALARKLQVSPMAASRWERGVNQPTAAIYIRLGKLAPDPDRWYFWEKAGLTRRDLEKSTNFKAARSSPIEAGGNRLQRKKVTPDLLPVPMYWPFPQDYSPGTTLLKDLKPVDVVVVPKEWCGPTDSTVCLRIEDDRMYPLMQVGTTVGVDLRQTELDSMQGKLVLALHPEKGAIVRWLQRYGDAWVLVPENRAYNPDFLNAEWRVIGRALWWFSKSF